MHTSTCISLLLFTILHPRITMVSQRLSAAAAELINAASSESNSMTAERSTEAIKNLREDMKGELTAFKESMEAMIATTNQNTNNININGNIENLNRRLSELDDKLTNLANIAIENRKMQRIEWAIANVDIVYDEDCLTPVDRDILRDILLTFRANKSYYFPIPNNCINSPEKLQSLRNIFSNLIHRLTGREPRIEASEQDGQQCYVVWYS